MKKEALTGIHFLEKTSYCDHKKEHFPLLWIMIQLASFGCIVLSTAAMLFSTLGFEFDMGLVGGMAAVGTLVCWLLSGRRPVFVTAVIVTVVAGAIYVWYHLESVAAGFLSLYHRGYALVSDYLAGVMDSSQWSGRLGTEIYVLLMLGLIVICGLFVFGFKKTLPALLPGILCAIGALLVGKVPPMPWFAVYLMSAVTLSACGYNRSRFGKSSALDAMAKHFFIRGVAGKSRSIGAWSALAVLAAMTLCIGLAIFIKDRIWSPDKEFLAAYQKEVRGWYKENVHLLDQEVDKSRGPARGGVNGGNLGSVGDLYYRGDEQLKVNVEVFPRWTVYIKGYVGEKYEDNRWVVGKSGEYETFADDNGLTARTKSQLFDLPFFGLEYAGLDRMHIEKLASFDDDYVFMPYGANAGEDAAWRQDLYIRGSGSTSEFSYSPAVYEYMKDYDGLQSMFGQDMTGGQEGLALEPVYREYVYSHYTQVPEETRQMLEGFSGLPQLDTLKEKVVYVRRQLHDACTYSLTPGELPSGRDFTEYFLTENKMGYCMHFATAATLMLRSLGVPARYVEGYIAVPGNFRGTDHGFEAVIRDHQAHAWAEIYLDGFGWVPVEMTPAYYDEANINAELDGNDAQTGGDETITPETDADGNPVPETDADGNPLPETDENGDPVQETDEDGNPMPQTDENGNPVPETDENGNPILQTDADGNPVPETDENGNPMPQTDENGETVLAGGDAYGAGGKGDGTGGAGGSGGAGADDATGLPGMVLKLLLWLGGILAAVILIAAALAIRAWLLYKKRMTAMVQKDKSRALVSIYGSLIRLFESCGYRYSDFDNMHDYFDKVSGDFDCMDMDAMDAFTDEVNRAAFSRDGADQETWQEGWRLYQNIRTEVLKSQKWLRRMYLKYIRGF